MFVPLEVESVLPSSLDRIHQEVRSCNRAVGFFRVCTLLALSVLLWGGGAPIGHAQSPLDVQYPAVEQDVYDLTYRPPSVEYRIDRGERFDLIYQEEAEDMAHRTRAALQSSWPVTDSIVGPVATDFHTPVVINNYGDVGNGFVEPFPFRQEIEAVSNKKAQLSARASSWPALVAPHELVHSAHGDIHAGVGVGGLIRVFAPDWTRALNLTAARGLVEGVAVYRESQLEPQAGRLHAPLFAMKMKAAMLSDDPWDLAQMLESPAYTQPFNRMYVAGGHAFEYLTARGDGPSTEFFQDAVRWHNRFPFLGFGGWLTASTGDFPSEITEEMQADFRETYRAELKQRRPFTPTSLVAGEEGLNHRRPYWLDDDTLVAYVHGYSVRAGFYRIDPATGQRTPVRIQTLTEDRVYSLSSDTSALYASRYVPDPLVPSRDVAEVERVSLSDGSARQLTSDGRALTPVRGPAGRLHVATNDGPFTRWSVVGDGKSPRPIAVEGPASVRQIAVSPTGGRVAVLVNADGQQGIYRADAPLGASPEVKPWFGLDGAVVYDLSWGPEGRYLLFAADHPETANIFAFDTQTKQVLQLANVPFGALEPALSPDRSTVAFVNYRHERHDLVTIPFRPDSASVVAATKVVSPVALPRAASRTAAFDELDLEDSDEYAAWQHLKPRMVYPSVHTVDDQLEVSDAEALGSAGVGVTLTAADPLKQWTYRGSAYWQDGGIWGEARVKTSQFLLRPSLSVFDRTARLSGARPGVEERGMGMGFRLPITLQSNVYQTLIRLGLDTEFRQIRLYDRGLQQPSPFSSRFTLNPKGVLGYRLQQNRRDVVPNSGVTIGVEGKFDSWVESGPLPLGARHALYSSANLYLPFLRDSHTGLRMGAALLTQNRSSFGTSSYVPRGYDHLQSIEGISRASGTFLRFDVEVTQPVWYIDEGVTLIPLYAKALSLYGFGQTLGRVGPNGWHETASSVGAGLSFQVRVFYVFDFDLRVGASYRPGRDDVILIHR